MTTINPLHMPSYEEATRSPLANVEATFQRWLHFPDPGALHVNLGAVAANRMPGDPAWLLNVGPPGCGKTELLGAFGRLPDVHPVATLTEAALLSGTAKKDRDPGAHGGLLRQMGDSGIILAKDFGSVLSMHRDARASVLAALREVYDGSWTRRLGTDGGQTLHWSGKAGLLGGCTPSIDHHHGVMAAMGERFTFYRVTVDEPERQALRALGRTGQEKRMREELAGSVKELFESIDLDLTIEHVLSESEMKRLVALSSLAVRCRSAVERDPYAGREITLVPEAEMPARLALVLARLLGGMAAVGVNHTDAWAVVVKVALDSMPALRRSVLETLIEVGEANTTTVATTLNYPNTTTKRALEDLSVHGVTIRESQGPGKADIWRPSTWTTDCWRYTQPETSDGVR